MASNYQHALVSYCTTPAAKETHEHYGEASYRGDEIKAFIKATCVAMGAVHHNTGHDSATIYRPGDTHVMGDIGYKDVRVKSRGASETMRQYFVRTSTIRNEKYRDTLWQHNIIATKSMKNAVAHAVDWLKPIHAADSIRLTSVAARTIIDKSVHEHAEKVKGLFKQLFGESTYGNKFDLPIYNELRYITFASPELNKLLTEFNENLNGWRDAKSIAQRGIHYVGLTDNYGQLVADVARCEALGHSTKISDIMRFPAMGLPEWVQGRVAVLQMMSPQTYVPGVGLRVDDKIFYVMEDEVE
jgi:hypothetical protein